MSYVIDTCALSEFTKPRPAASVERWFSEVAEREQFVSVLTLGELEKGVRKLAKGRRRASFEDWLRELRKRFEERVLVVDEAVAMEWARIAAAAEAAGKPLPIVDSLIAATASVHGMSVVTRNTSDIARAGVSVIDPWI